MGIPISGLEKRERKGEKRGGTGLGVTRRDEGKGEFYLVWRKWDRQVAFFQGEGKDGNEDGRI